MEAAAATGGVGVEAAEGLEDEAVPRGGERVVEGAGRLSRSGVLVGAPPTTREAAEGDLSIGSWFAGLGFVVVPIAEGGVGAAGGRAILLGARKGGFAGGLA